MSRKYRQRGYMDYDGNHDQQKNSQNKKERREFDGPRGRSASPMFKSFHCERCGENFPEIAQIDFDQKCPSCNADFHCCSGCNYFDPGSRFECMKPIEQSIPRKDLANQCLFFAPKFTWKHAVSPKSLTADEARKVLDNLFKK
ncbi:MAG: hypothetical protein A2161_04225 [Candidatus Schekmanbacteria bacterium RBG_13_48_7]|uniref:Uncharacterized protein n=1 Tax=Candidatus Schekmanbacteria bacterium RBG_13_48_7 TaxID=1817878 RepID=A0A1F7RMH0_9BACT|nr:MAG: hypothetical protein A2161_04225 [Candidatus Schekmanbacteria bacterium RBG_13_48_7]